MKTIIEMAHEVYGEEKFWIEKELLNLKAFAELVRADERDKWMERAHIMILGEREGCHALRQTLPNPHKNCQVSAHAYDMAIASYGAAIRARGEQA